MNTKIIIGIVVVIVLAGAGYFIYQKYAGPSASPGGTQNQSGTPQVQGQDVKVGDGAQAKPGDIVSVLYTGRLADGTVFDSSASHGNQPLRFTLGAPGIIPGFQIGVNGMKVGGERLLSIPPALAYGTQDVKDASGKVVIPANSTITFSVQLVKVEAGTSTPAAATTTR